MIVADVPVDGTAAAASASSIGEGDSDNARSAASVRPAASRRLGPAPGIEPISKSSAWLLGPVPSPSPPRTLSACLAPGGAGPHVALALAGAFRPTAPPLCPPAPTNPSSASSAPLINASALLISPCEFSLLDPCATCASQSASSSCKGPVRTGTYEASLSTLLHPPINTRPPGPTEAEPPETERDCPPRVRIDGAEPGG